MVFTTDLTDDEIKYLIYQPDYNKLNDDIVHNNIRYKSPMPGFKWTLKNKINNSQSFYLLAPRPDP